jgi:GDP-D-mannose dehydratase
MMVRVMSVVPSSYCAPESTRKIWSVSIRRLLEVVTR